MKDVVMYLVNPMLLILAIISLVANYLNKPKLEYIAITAVCGILLIVLNRRRS